MLIRVVGDEKGSDPSNEKSASGSSMASSPRASPAQPKRVPRVVDSCKARLGRLQNRLQGKTSRAGKC